MKDNNVHMFANYLNTVKKILLMQGECCDYVSI